MEGLVNVGLSLDRAPEERTWEGIMQLLLRLSNEMEFKVIHARTMKANKADASDCEELGF